jgi:hypothetical protein
MAKGLSQETRRSIARPSTDGLPMGMPVESIAVVAGIAQLLRDRVSGCAALVRAAWN